MATAPKKIASPAEERRLSSKEAHDLGQIIKERAKVLEAHAEEQATACLADFERKISATFAFDADDVWKKAVAQANHVIVDANKLIAERCRKLGIPEEFAPGLQLVWSERGQNRVTSRRSELRRVAEAEVEAMKRAAITKIRRQSLDLRTQVVSMCVMSSEAKLFLESFAPVEDAMASIDFTAIESKVNDDIKRRQSLRQNYIGYQK